jgi:hypothetical protein
MHALELLQEHAVEGGCFQKWVGSPLSVSPA